MLKLMGKKIFTILHSKFCLCKPVGYEMAIKFLNMCSGAYEFYLFHFCYLLVNPQWQTKSYYWNNLSDVAYPCLFDNYLRHFLPLNKKSLPKFPQTKMSPVRSPVVPQTPHSRFGILSSVADLCKQFEPRSGLTECQA